MSDTISKSWFLTFGNPEEHGYKGTPEEICCQMRDEFIGNSETRSGAWAYCISANGFHHVHMVLEDCKAMRFSYIKNNFYKGANIQETKGSKKQAMDYINKRGVFAEKGETIEFIVYHGEILGNQGKRRDLEDIYKRLETGETPTEIFETTPTAYARKDVIRQMFYDIRSRNTPIVRKMNVIWHTGRSGSGKSYERVLLCDKYGEDSIYYLTAFNSGAFDLYNGEKILWIEDFRGEFKLQELLRLLDVYKAQVPARFNNVKALWEEVHITSVLTPQQCYEAACKDEYDRIDQLLRRITSICYHFKDNSGTYRKMYFPSNTLLNDMINQVNDHIKALSEWIPIDVSQEWLSDYVDLTPSYDDGGGGVSPVGLPLAAEDETNETN